MAKDTAIVIMSLSVCPSAHSPVCSSVRSSYQNFDHDNLKTSELILIPVGTGGPRGNDTKWSTLGVKMLQKIKFT